MLELNHVTLHKQGRHILGPINLTLKPGELLAVVGANGAGKSSLLSILCGLERQFNGNILYTGPSNKQQASALEIARRRALMPQFHALSFDFTVSEVVALGRNPHYGLCTLQRHQHIVDRAMRLTNVLELADRPYTRLSGGQQARVQFARVLAQLDCGEGEAELLLLDEPTASLDLRCQRELMSTVRNLCNGGLGAVAVLHDINLAAHYADRIAVLKSGRLLSMGTVQEVVTESLLTEAFQLPVQVLDNALPNRRLIVV